jgi:hypothetical protein
MTTQTTPKTEKVRTVRACFYHSRDGGRVLLAIESGAPMTDAQLRAQAVREAQRLGIRLVGDYNERLHIGTREVHYLG